MEYETTIDDSQWIKKKELLEVIENMKYPYHKALFSILFLSGSRISEVTSLKRYDITVDYESTSIEIIMPNLKQRGRPSVKGRLPIAYVRSAPKKTILVDLDQDLDIAVYLIDYIEDMPNNKILFESNKIKGEPISIQWAIELAKEYFSNMYDGNMRTHKVGRHSYVMTSATRGATFTDVKEQGGWSRTDSISGYLHRFGVKDRLKRLKALKDN